MVGATAFSRKREKEEEKKTRQTESEAQAIRATTFVTHSRNNPYRGEAIRRGERAYGRRSSLSWLRNRIASRSGCEVYIKRDLFRIKKKSGVKKKKNGLFARFSIYEGKFTCINKRTVFISLGFGFNNECVYRIYQAQELILRVQLYVSRN